MWAAGRSDARFPAMHMGGDADRMQLSRLVHLMSNGTSSIISLLPTRQAQLATHFMHVYKKSINIRKV